MADNQKPTESHSELFGLQGQKRASTTAGSGAGSGIIGTSGHPGAANKGGSFDAQAMQAMQATENTTAGLPQGGKTGAVPGSGAESFTPNQGAGDVGKDA